MANPPSWLPPQLVLDNNWDKAVRQLYTVFEHDFINNHFRFGNRLVWWDRDKIDSPYDESFWHITTREDKKTKIRYPDFPRAKKITWCRPCIKHFYEKEILNFDYPMNWGIATYLWLKNHDYVVILKKKTLSKGLEVAYLKTAFNVDGQSTRNQLQERFDNRIT